MIGMQDQDPVQRFDQDRIGLEVVARAKHHPT